MLGKAFSSGKPGGLGGLGNPGSPLPAYSYAVSRGSCHSGRNGGAQPAACSTFIFQSMNQVLVVRLHILDDHEQLASHSRYRNVASNRFLATKSSGRIIPVRRRLRRHVAAQLSVASRFGSNLVQEQPFSTADVASKNDGCNVYFQYPPLEAIRCDVPFVFGFSFVTGYADHADGVTAVFWLWFWS